MGQAWISFLNVSFSYDSATSPLIEGLTVDFPVGWTGIVGANGVGKTTILKLATGALSSQNGVIQSSGNAIYCPQRTDDIPPGFGELIQAMDGEAYRIKAQLGMEDEWLERWDTLSHGERKRAQIGVMLWHRPQALAVDEPTNHLDTEAIDRLAQALCAFRGIGLLVSHDRELLDSLCQQCLFVEPPETVMRPGGYTKGAQQAKREETHARKQRDIARREYAKLTQEAIARREEASKAHQKRSKRGIPIKDHDARFKKNIARFTGKDGVDGKLLRQLDGRLEQARKKQESIKVKKTYKMGIWLEGSRSKRDTLFRMPAGSIPLGGDRWLSFPDLVMRPDDRIALTGPNGGGKSTLVRHIVSSLNIPQERVTYVPQEINMQSSRDIMDQVRNLSSDKLGHTMGVVSRLGSRPQRLLESTEPSPGEIRKIFLSMGIANVPHLIIMDEPTNHLDLPSIECLEEALDDCPCGLLLVSHDRRFLKRLTRTRWHISPTEEDTADSRMVLGVR